MERKIGQILQGGIAKGKIKYIAKKENVTKWSIVDIEQEIGLLNDAINVTKNQLLTLSDKLSKCDGNADASIISAQMMLVDDPVALGGIREIIESESINSEYATAVIRDRYADMIEAVDDGVISKRGDDIRDVYGKLIENIVCIRNSKQSDDSFVENAPKYDNGVVLESFIVYAENLLPSDAIIAIQEGAAGFVTKYGSKISHVGVLISSFNVPYITGIDLSPETSGELAVILDNELVISPDAELLKEYDGKSLLGNENGIRLSNLIGKETITGQGKRLPIYANISTAKDIEDVIKNDAEGIGLFRSEYLYLERDDYPSEEEQFEDYKAVLLAMNPKEVVVRTLDVGADKSKKYLNIKQEGNPALGYRGIRFCLDRPNVFKTQLRALYRASAYGNLSIMYPMIISADEVMAAKKISKEVREELTAQGYKIGNVKEGVMIETPAAALVSDELAKVSDFFSLGTNDLTQYTLAYDRETTRLYEFYDPYHLAVMKLIKIACDNAHKAGIKIAICGDLGSDFNLTRKFIELGIDELSVPPRWVLPMRDKISEI